MMARMNLPCATLWQRHSNRNSLFSAPIHQFQGGIMIQTITLGEYTKDRPAVVVESGKTVAEAAKVLTEVNKGAILVVEGGKLKGIFTERDLLRRVAAEGLDPAKTQVDQVMTRSLVVGRPDENHHVALRRMVSAGCRHLPVVDGDKVVSVVSRRDLMAIDIQQLEQEVDRLDPATLFI